VPRLVERVAEIYGVQAGKRCPGEDRCEDFASFAEPKAHGCVGCQFLPTKPPITIAALTTEDEREIEATVKTVASLARHQQAGFVLSLRDVSPLEYELLKVWHAEAAAIERGNQAQHAALIAAALGIR